MFRWQGWMSQAELNCEPAGAGICRREGGP